MNSKKTGMRHSIKKNRSERPQDAFLQWIQKEIASSKQDAPTIHMNFDKMMLLVFRPAKISEASAYLFFQRLIRNESDGAQRIGTVLTNGKSGEGKAGYTFVPKRKLPEKTVTPKPVVKAEPAHPDLMHQLIDSHRFMSKSLTLLAEHVATLGDKVGVISKELGIADATKQ